MKEGIRFKETQKFTQWWLWLIILAPIILFVIKVISTRIYVFGGYAAAETSNTNMIWIANRVTLGELLPYFFYLLTVLFLVLIKLKVVVSDKKIKIRHLLFFSKIIDLNEVVEQQIINYDFVGFGIRKIKKYGTVYNVKGKEGISLTLKNGKKYLIGTQKPKELLAAIRS
ncbi:hypothetical protein QSV08_02800 [Maribacter sp. BPC-D8]|uniref:hypothetical protein n=1 Tax=Maribacter sp. BPC-D8 TaxID=3053613 RepID=UPI002B499119|nr:hypothetical protein [Maribacter sp. BPC-D8]WRI30171.1 hypothetical protein QSV08_02800 [Maribacter sp. BPC-D8]